MNSFTDVVLHTDRLVLRPMAMADTDALFAMRADPEVQRYGSHAPWTERQTAIDYIARNEKAMAEGAHAQFAIERRADGVVVGTCTLFHLDAQSRRADCGYVLLRSEWGQGYATEAMTALLDWGFGKLALHRVEADIDPRNNASAKVLERLGFRHEGHLRERWIVAGEISDSGLYGLLAREWAATRASRADARG